MLERLPTVLSAQEVLDKAFHKAAKIQVQDPSKYHRVRKEIMSRIRAASDSVTATLERYTRAIPDLETVREYEREVLDIVVGLPALKRAVQRIRWAQEMSQSLAMDHEAKGQRVRSIDGFHQLLKRHYGRLSSVVYDINGPLALLGDLRDQVRHLPTIAPDHPTVVVAGFPNVGKTSLLRAWTASKAEVREYAFTTKHAEVGHMDVAGRFGSPRRIQVVDTPGLLDRPDEERNEIERHAVAALRHAADAVVYVLDPSETSGYTWDEQNRLLEQVREEMRGLPLLAVEAKTDLPRQAPETDLIRFSNVTGEGLEALRDAIVAVLPEEGEGFEEDPIDRARRLGA